MKKQYFQYNDCSGEQFMKFNNEEHARYACQQLHYEYVGLVSKEKLESLQDRQIEDFGIMFIYLAMDMVALDYKISKANSLRLIAQILNENNHSWNKLEIKKIGDIIYLIEKSIGDSKSKNVTYLWETINSSKENIELNWLNGWVARRIETQYYKKINKLGGTNNE